MTSALLLKIECNIGQKMFECVAPEIMMVPRL